MNVGVEQPHPPKRNENIPHKYLSIQVEYEHDVGDVKRFER